MTDAWEGTVIKKSRGLLDGSNMYRRLKIRCSDGKTATVRVARTLWDSTSIGDVVVKKPGKDPVKM